MIWTSLSDPPVMPQPVSAAVDPLAKPARRYYSSCMSWRTFIAAVLIAGSATAAEHVATLKIGGWHSKGDGLKTQLAVQAVKGVKSATPDVPKKTLVVTFEETQATQAQVEKAVVDAGYEVEK